MTTSTPMVPATQPAPSDSREERKYPVAEHRAPLLAAWLGARLQADPQYPLGVITSCYYDTARLDAYWDSFDGNREKAKLRLRWYGEPPDAAAGGWLEVKQRDGGLSFKRRRQLQGDELDGAALGEGLVLPSRADAARFAKELLPSGWAGDAAAEAVVLVRYERRRWRDAASGLRVSLDTRVRCARPAPGLHWRPLPQGAVLELKSSGPLPPRLQGLARFGLRRSAHSKYVIAMDALRGGARARVGG